jgi:PAS domain S-box-containing protein
MPREEERRLRSVALQNAHAILLAREEVERQLGAERERLRITLASIGDGVISTDSLGRVEYLNAVAERLTGWAQAEAAGRPLAEVFRIVNETTREPAEDPAERALRDGRVAGLANHAVLIARDGSERPIDDSAAPMLDGSGAAVGVVLVFRDATERRAADAARARLAAIVESSQDAIVSKSLQGIIQTWNAGAERLFGFTAAEAVGQSITIVIPPDRLAEEAIILAQVARGEPIRHYETVRVAKDGRRLHISLTVSPIRDAEGVIIGASKVARDITDRKAADDALREAVTALREAERRKDEFLALLAHELRNPLAPLRHGLEVMRRAPDDSKLVAKMRDLMDRQVSHMVRLIDDLLDVARIGSDKMELRRARVLLADVISSAVEIARPALEAAGHKLTLLLPPEPILLHADLTRLAQVFGNLLHNSAKYTERGGQIWLTAARDGNEAVVAVRDTGIGIPASSLPRIFDLFSQVDPSIERSRSGLGIGLSLVKGLVEMHGGTVKAESVGPGRGSTFTVRLPMLEARAEPAAEETAARRPLAGGSKRRILVVDDNADAAESLARMLQLWGNETRIAEDGFKAITVAEEFRPQVILMDLGMPQLNGYEATRRIREQPWGREPAVIALTGYGQEADRERSMAAGCNGHLVKPVDLQELEKLLRT